MNEKKKLRRLPKRILAFMLMLAMVMTLMPMHSGIVYAKDWDSAKTIWYYQESFEPQTWRAGMSADNFLSEGDVIPGNHYVQQNRGIGAKLYADGVLITPAPSRSESTETISGTVVKINGNTIYLCSSHTEAVGTFCSNCSVHDHSWNYSADGETLKAWCTASECTTSYTTEDTAVTLTLSATSPNYSGTEYSGATVKDSANKEYSASNNAWKVANAGEITVKYVGRDGTTYTESTTAPTKIGKYTVKLYPSSEESTRTHVATANFEITRKTDYDGKLIDFADTNWEYKFYTNGSYTSNVAGDTSGTVEKLKFYNISGENVTYSGAPFSPTLDSNHSNELTPSMIAGLISSVTNGVGVTCAYNASAHKLTITPIVHTHDWKYSATGNKLEAYCANADCPSGTDADHKVSITLTASSQDYSGSAVEATMDTTAWEAAGLTAPMIVYEAKNGSALTDGKAVNVGSYKAKITEGGKTASKDFEIISASANKTSFKEPEKVFVDLDTNKSEVAYGTVFMHNKDNVRNIFDMKVHSVDTRTKANQEFLAASYAKNQGKRARILITTGIYPRNKLAAKDIGTKKFLSFLNLEKKIMPVYAVCYNQTDKAYYLTGTMNANGTAVFNDFIARDATNITIFVLE